MQNQHSNASITRKSINQQSSLPNIKLHHQVPPGQEDCIDPYIITLIILRPKSNN